MADKYYTRPRKELDPKKWAGPFDLLQLKEQAQLKRFTKELHEYSEDNKVTWLLARQIWPILFPPKKIDVNRPPTAMPTVVTQAAPAETAQITDSGGLQITQEEESAEWYCSIDGEQQGPFTTSQLRDFVTRGQLQPTDMIWCPKVGNDWIEAQSEPSLYQVATTAGIELVDDKSPNRSDPIPPMAIASFVSGLLGATCVPVFGSILAIIFGHIGLSQMRRSRAKNGKWMAITGLVLGYVMLAFGLITIIVYVGLVLANS